jgi:methylenetetrahydrofolate dehydrogenase (NADP+)/methenyltetrahydrofolate cyclohydrolase
MILSESDSQSNRNQYRLLDGKKLSAQIRDELKQEVKGLNQQGIFPNLGVILVGEFAPSVIYVRNKETACADVGIKTETLKIKDDISEKELEAIIQDWNQDRKINGILVQMPLPKHINHQKILDSIHPIKDVDGLSVSNLGHLIAGESPMFYPCTPSGIIEILVRYGITIEGKHCVIVGRGELVGKPLANMLLRKDKTGNATVTVCHSRTENIGHFTRQADILIVAIGQPHFITEDMVKPGAVIIDVGVNRIQTANRQPPTTKLVGDVDFEPVSKIASAITPVPGGVGPMTIAMLLRNTLKAAKLQQ